MHRVTALLVMLIGLVACGPSPGSAYLNSTDHDKRLGDLYERVWKKTAEAFLAKAGFLGNIETFPLTATADVGISGQEVCTQARKEAKPITSEAHFILACSKDSHHSVVFRAENGKPTMNEGPWPVMFYDGTLFRSEAGVLIVSMSNTGASARTSSRSMSPEQLKALDDELIKRWREGYKRFYNQELPV